MINQIFIQLFSKENSKRFRLLNLSIFLPVLFWPLIFYTTIFFFDNPDSQGLAYLLFFAVNAYPIYLLIIAYFNSRLLQKNKLLGSILPVSILLVLSWGIAYFFVDLSRSIDKNMTIAAESKEKGFIGSNDVFRIVHDNVYRFDTLIAGADAKSFELVSWDWQRDANYYYRFGKRIDYIDRASFELLGYHYAKDKDHVYYDEKIIEGAEAKTFRHIPGTQDGKDALNCYRWGKRVDCEVLKTEY